MADGLPAGKTREQGEADSKSAATEPLPEFVNLLLESCRGRPLLIKSELHYLKVVTERGSGLVLYNMDDAVDALPADAGMQVHRSDWVAFDAIDRLQRRGRQGELILRDGERVPVSRQRYRQVSEALSARAADLPADAAMGGLLERGASTPSET